MNFRSFSSLSKVALITVSFIATVGCNGKYDDDDSPADLDSPSVPESIIEPNFGTTVTHAGGTYTVNGLATVLTYDSASQSFAFENQDRSGMTLYTFDNDPIDASACTSESCVDTWSPLLVVSDTLALAPLSAVTRDDGYSQLALRGKPLYFYSGDVVPGDVNGEAAGGVWHVAKTEPVALVDESIASAVNGYLVADGKVLLSAPQTPDSTDTFIAQTADMDGMSLYTFDGDPEGSSICNSDCLAAWPALLAYEGDVAEAPFSIIDRQMNEFGGTARQWAYHGKPLYFFAQDFFPGSAEGKDIPNWTLLRPKPVLEEEGVLASSGVVSVETSTGLSAVPKHLFSLYTFDSDTYGVSNCNDGCLDNWPALIAHEDAVATAPFSLVQRNSGEMQWALRGLPLYLFNGDLEPGDTNGDGANGVWHLAQTSLITQKITALGGSYTVSGITSVLTNTLDVALQDRRGMSLYIFDSDPVGASSCNSTACLSSWPPLIASDEASAEPPFSIISRVDGHRQWALRGKPLYFYTGDSDVGDINGEQFGGLWHVAQTEPLMLADNATVAGTGEFFVASGDVLVSAPESEGDTSTFVIYRQNMAGMSLYTFDDDFFEQSNCTGQCLVNWPALLAEADDVAEAPFSIVNRQMNEAGGYARQWAYRGKPLYFFLQDSVPGDTFGKDIANWNLLRPEPFIVGQTNGKATIFASDSVYVARSENNGSESVTLAAKHGFSLYTFDNDVANVSSCTDACLDSWPALMAHDGAVAQSPYSLIDRAGGQQWALNGKPLYFYSLDVNAGDALGDGLNSLWHVAEINSNDDNDSDDDDTDGGYGY